MKSQLFETFTLQDNNASYEIGLSENKEIARNKQGISYSLVFCSATEKISVNFRSLFKQDKDITKILEDGLNGKGATKEDKIKIKKFIANKKGVIKKNDEKTPITIEENGNIISERAASEEFTYDLFSKEEKKSTIKISRTGKKTNNCIEYKINHGSTIVNFSTIEKEVHNILNFYTFSSIAKELRENLGISEDEKSIDWSFFPDKELENKIIYEKKSQQIENLLKDIHEKKIINLYSNFSGNLIATIIFIPHKNLFSLEKEYNKSRVIRLIPNANKLETLGLIEHKVKDDTKKQLLAIFHNKYNKNFRKFIIDLEEEDFKFSENSDNKRTEITFILRQAHIKKPDWRPVYAYSPTIITGCILTALMTTLANTTSASTIASAIGVSTQYTGWLVAGIGISSGVLPFVGIGIMALTIAAILFTYYYRENKNIKDSIANKIACFFNDTAGVDFKNQRIENQLIGASA